MGLKKIRTQPWIIPTTHGHTSSSFLIHPKSKNNSFSSTPHHNTQIYAIMAGDESRYNEVPNRCSTRKRRVLNSIGLVLSSFSLCFCPSSNENWPAAPVIWDLLLAIPISYGLTILAYKTAGVSASTLQVSGTYLHMINFFFIALPQ